MKNIFKYTILSILVTILIFSCNEEKLNDNSILTDLSPQETTELDLWAEKNFTTPYNVQLVYKYDDKRIPQEDWVVPVSYEKSIQMANILKYLFFDAYKKHTPEDFLKRFCPKTIMLLGSGAYNPNGTVKLGLAENGVQFTLLKINDLDPSNVQALYSNYFRTIYHEFSHILHQTTDYSQDFKRISAGDYVRDSWNSEWKNKSSLEAGFISDYSSKNPNEDFVELIAHYLTYTPQQWQATLNRASGKDDGSGDKPGKKILERKISIVLEYMQNTWNVNLNNLRDEIQERARNINNLDLNTLK